MSDLPNERPPIRIALGLSFKGTHYAGWQSQRDQPTLQDALERALAQFVNAKVTTLCAGRTDSGVHGLMQVVHFDTHVDRPETSWVRGLNALLPKDISVAWARRVPQTFHARGSAVGRHYVYSLLCAPVRPSLEWGHVGWVFRPLNPDAMQSAKAHWLGTHDFSSFRASECQALSPIKTLRRLDISRRGAYWRFEFEADAFLHHMIRNLMGTLLAIGQEVQPPEWAKNVLEARSRKVAAPTFSPDGLYFAGPIYGPEWAHLDLPTRTPAYDWLP
jgi:tRNA pseudouridine38-40 synthase